MIKIQFPFTTTDKTTIRRTLLEEDGTIIYPTETFYALGCAADQAKAVNNIYRLKKRDHELPLLVLVDSWEMFYRYARIIHSKHIQLLKKHWPGPLTAILPHKNKLAKDLNNSGLFLGFRMTSSAIAQELISITGVPLVGTSANISSKMETNNLPTALETFRDSIDIYIDGGKTPGIKPSTIVDLTKERYTVVREGMISI